MTMAREIENDGLALAGLLALAAPLATHAQAGKTGLVLGMVLEPPSLDPTSAAAATLRSMLGMLRLTILSPPASTRPRSSRRAASSAVYKNRGTSVC